MYEGPGTYKHWKGHHYEVVGLACNESIKERGGFDPSLSSFQNVVYHPLEEGGRLDNTEVEFWVRPRSDFDAVVNGKPRFLRVGD